MAFGNYPVRPPRELYRSKGRTLSQLQNAGQKPEDAFNPSRQVVAISADLPMAAGTSSTRTTVTFPRPTKVLGLYGSALGGFNERTDFSIQVTRSENDKLVTDPCVAALILGSDQHGPFIMPKPWNLQANESLIVEFFPTTTSALGGTLSPQVSFIGYENRLAVENYNDEHFDEPGRIVIVSSGTMSVGGVADNVPVKFPAEGEIIGIVGAGKTPTIVATTFTSAFDFREWFTVQIHRSTGDRMFIVNGLSATTGSNPLAKNVLGNASNPYRLPTPWKIAAGEEMFVDFKNIGVPGVPPTTSPFEAQLAFIIREKRM